MLKFARTQQKGNTVTNRYTNVACFIRGNLDHVMGVAFLFRLSQGVLSGFGKSQSHDKLAPVFLRRAGEGDTLLPTTAQCD